MDDSHQKMEEIIQTKRPGMKMTNVIGRIYINRCRIQFDILSENCHNNLIDHGNRQVLTLGQCLLAGNNHPFRGQIHRCLCARRFYCPPCESAVFVERSHSPLTAPHQPTKPSKTAGSLLPRDQGSRDNQHSESILGLITELVKGKSKHQRLTINATITVDSL
jgi:hypothetical protein